MDTPWFSRFFERAGATLVDISQEDFLALVLPKCKQIITQNELEHLLAQGKKLKVKLGVDATGTELHLGHAVPLMLLQLFLRRGHEVHFIIGDFTGQIGDPSGRSDGRTQLSLKDIQKNIKTYKSQIARLIDIKKIKVHKNSSWLSKMPLGEYLRIAGVINFSAIAQRDDFRERSKTEAGVTLREAAYASLMAIDSVHIEADIEVGGIDQLLNMMQVREVMEAEGHMPETVLTTPLIEGTSGDGRKMSKSFNNYIALMASAKDQFGLVMSIPDSLMLSYYISFADIYEHEVNDLRQFIGENPFEAKKELAMLMVALLHNKKDAQKARADFERKFSKGEFIEKDEKQVFVAFPITIFDALVVAFGGGQSKTSIRSLLEQGGVRRIGSDGEQETIKSFADNINPKDRIKVGKMNLFKFLLK